VYWNVSVTGVHPKWLIFIIYNIQQVWVAIALGKN
jgi:hypothetical protein